MPEIHSTGRGGAGNIGEDSTVYVDGGIVREGPQGQSATGTEYSSGRGGAGNIDGRPTSAKPVNGNGSGKNSPAVVPVRRTDEDIIPEPAMHQQHYENYHTGRGGQGNVHKDKYGGHSKPQTKDHMVKEHGATAAQAEAQAPKKEGIADKVKALFNGKH